MIEEFTRFNLTDKEKSKMTTREVIRYLRAKKEWINNNHPNRLSATKGNKKYVEGHQKLLTTILDSKTLNKLARKIKTREEKISTSQQTWNQEFKKQKIN